MFKTTKETREITFKPNKETCLKPPTKHGEITFKPNKETCLKPSGKHA